MRPTNYRSVQPIPSTLMQLGYINGWEACFGENGLINLIKKVYYRMKSKGH